MAKRSAELTRDDVISRARYGKITPDEAEAQAVARGWPPFASEPELPAFDPMQESRWSIVMAVAWIAWRDIGLVREQCPGFRSDSTFWLYRKWNEPVKGGTEFAPHEGWFLETWREATTVGLVMQEAVLTAKNELPSTLQMSIRDAEAALWRALSEGSLVAEALDAHGKPVDIPQREWSYLQLFEDGKRDVLKYAALDSDQPFTKVKIKCDDILNLWPRIASHLPVNKPTDWPIEPSMLRPISDPGNAGYVPLCCALLWIMTEGGVREVKMDDHAAWSESVEKLRPFLTTGDVELIGLPLGESMTEPLQGHTLTLVKILAPLENNLGDILFGSPSHIVSNPFLDAEHWSHIVNDQLYVPGLAKAAWSHLQVRKSQILDRWPRSTSMSNVEQDCYRWLCQAMQASLAQKPQSRDAFWSTQSENFHH